MAKRKNPAAVALGKRGARAKYRKMTGDERSDAAKKAVTSRWSRMTAEERRKATLPMRKARKAKARKRKAK